MPAEATPFVTFVVIAFVALAVVLNWAHRRTTR